MTNLLKMTSFFTLILLTLVFFTACGRVTEPGAGGEELALLREIQSELSELRDENQELRRDNAQLMEHIEELNNAANTELVETTWYTTAENPTPPPPVPAPDEPATNDSITIDVHIHETPEPTPSPTPPPASLIGRWTTVGFVEDDETVHAPPHQSLQLDFFQGGTGMMSIEGEGHSFTWTGGDTGYIGRIVMSFTGSFGHDMHTETVSYRIESTTMYMTHDIFYETLTTVLRKAN